MLDFLLFLLRRKKKKKVGIGANPQQRNPGPQTSTTLHLSHSRWFYRTPPTLIGRLPVQPSQAERLRRPQTGSVARSVR